MQNLEAIHAMIEKAAKKSGRSSKDVKIVAVSKLQGAEKIRAVEAEGISTFGENYVQEALEKQQKLVDLQLQWHFIGKIQSNKIKQIVGRFQLIHSVDRWKSAEEISKRAGEADLIQDLLIEVNLGAETSKGGLSREALYPFLQKCKVLPHVRLCGLMLMPPISAHAEKLRPLFTETRELLAGARREVFHENFETHPFKELSMGTSQDFHVAIEEGATIVRLGTILFGQRPPREVRDESHQ